MIDLKTFWLRLAARAAKKDDLNLIVSFERSDERYLDNLHFQSYLFAQLSSQSVFGIFSRANEPAGDPPSAARTKTVLKQQNSTALINDNCACRDSKS